MESAESLQEVKGRGIRLFDEQCFFEAHECFELIWKAAETADQDRRFWKGVTQVAVGCCHAQRGNVRGGLALLERSRAYLQGYPSPHLGINTAALVSITRAVADQVRQGETAAGLEFPTFPTVAAP